MEIDVSNGEILDKQTILQIKLEEIKDENKLINIKKEYDILTSYINKIYFLCDNINDVYILHNELLNINRELWIIEDSIRECEQKGDFSQSFIDLARSVYFTNDKRSDIKKRINILTGSDLIEEKGYSNYS